MAFNLQIIEHAPQLVHLAISIKNALFSIFDFTLDYLTHFNIWWAYWHPYIFAI